jgi:hypothetical protein
MPLSLLTILIGNSLFVGEDEPGAAQRLFLALPIFLFLAQLYLNAPGFPLPLPGVRFQRSAFQRFSFCLHAQVFAFRPPVSGFSLSAFQCFSFLLRASRASCAGSAVGAR